MASSKRFTKTKHPGVVYSEKNITGARRPKRVYYLRYRKGKKGTFEPAERDDTGPVTSPGYAAEIRGQRMRGEAMTNAERKAFLENPPEGSENDQDRVWTLNSIWDLYCEKKVLNKGLRNEQFKWEKHCRDSIGKKEPGDLVPLDIDRIRLKLQKAGKKTMAARVLELIRRTVNYGVNNQIVGPISFKIKPPTLNNETTETLLPEQLQKLHEVLDAETDQAAASVMRLALYTGMRKGEILKLKWADLDFDRGFITIVDPKGTKDETIPMNELSREVLNSIDKDPTSPFLYPGKDGGYQKDFKRSFARIRDEAELPEGFRPLHGLRHTFASNLASSGQVDMFTLSKMLTHKSDKMTRRYAHLSDDAFHRAASMAGDLMKPKTTKQKAVVKIRKKK